MTPTQRSLALCRSNGWDAGIVERRLPRSVRDEDTGTWRQVPGGRTHDLFGFADLIVMDDGRGALAVQCFTTLVSEHKATCESDEVRPKVLRWLRMGNRVELWAWRKRSWKRKDGEPAKSKRWKLTVFVCRWFHEEITWEELTQ